MLRSYSINLATLLILLAIIFSPALAFGAPLPSIVPCGGADQPSCTVCHLMQVAQNVLNVGIFIAIFFSSLLFAWAGILYLTQSANIIGQDKAKNVFKSVFFGLLLILAAWLIIDTIMKVLVDPNKTITSGIKIGPWNEICE